MALPISYRSLAVSTHPVARTVRAVRGAIRGFTLPAPKLIFRPILWSYLALRNLSFWLRRVFICEPLFKAYCAQCGKGVRTGVFLHWIQGKGDLIVEDDVLLDGKSTLAFAARFSERPTLRIGSRTIISHNCILTVAQAVSIGSDCMIASDVFIFDSSGHPADPAARLAKLPPAPEEIRPVTIGNNVWIGRRATIFPGVTIGEGSVVSSGAVVTSDVPPYTLVAGNPARRVSSLTPPASFAPHQDAIRGEGAGVSGEGRSG
jgi:acetyltransferase-like isoleucine patch superfamily enzyme